MPARKGSPPPWTEVYLVIPAADSPDGCAFWRSFAVVRVTCKWVRVRRDGQEVILSRHRLRYAGRADDPGGRSFYTAAGLRRDAGRLGLAAYLPSYPPARTVEEAREALRAMRQAAGGQRRRARAG